MAEMRIAVPTDGPWILAAEVAQRLLAAGYETWFAGGCVRDLVLDAEVHDVDIATAARPEQMETLFPHTTAVGKAFGIIVVIGSAGGMIEVATFRSDGPSHDGRHPDAVIFTRAEADVARRDFTMNALLMSPVTGDIRDHVGGLDDLRQQILRCVGVATQRFSEDQLRVLRALRFAARFALVISPDTWLALVNATVTGLSRERIWQEFFKATALSALAVERWCQLLHDSGHETVFLPDGETGARHGAAQAAVANASQAVRLAVWLHGQRSVIGIATWLARQNFSTVLVRSVQWLWLAGEPPSPPGKAQRHWRRCAAHPQVEELAAYCRVVAPHHGHELAHAQAWRQAHPGIIVLGGDALIGLGIPQGPMIGSLRQRLEDYQLDGVIIDRATAMDLVQGWAREIRTDAR